MQFFLKHRCIDLSKIALLKDIHTYNDMYILIKALMFDLKNKKRNIINNFLYSFLKKMSIGWLLFEKSDL